MPRRLKKRSRKAGLPPGSLIHIGDRLTEKTKITVFDYDESHLLEKEISTVRECQQFKNNQNVSWIHVEGLHDTQILEELGALFGLHPLILEDILNTDQRPKMEDFCEYIYIVLKTFANHGDEIKDITSEQISIILGPTFVISFQEKETDIFKPIQERIRAGKGRLRKSGSDYLAYALIDTVVDNYFTILEQLGEEIEMIEESLVKNPSVQTLQAIQNLKRNMIFLRKSIWPLRETISGLERTECQLIHDSTTIFLKDIYDHTIQVIDTIETYRDMLSGILDIYLSSVSNRMNEIMKVLTIIATIFMPLTFMAGIYGMNFKYMPELEWHWGYFLILGFMMVVAVTMLTYFRRKKWW
ncbi:MAG: magnesium/cobalt transporter CorA [Syntrophaceae bacterium]